MSVFWTHFPGRCHYRYLPAPSLPMLCSGCGQDPGPKVQKRRCSTHDVPGCMGPKDRSLRIKELRTTTVRKEETEWSPRRRPVGHEGGQAHGSKLHSHCDQKATLIEFNPTQPKSRHVKGDWLGFDSKLSLVRYF